MVLHLTKHRVGDLLGHIRPDGDDLVVALTVRDRPFQILLLDTENLVVRLLDQRRFLGRHDEVVDADRQTGPGRVAEPEVFETI